MNPVSIIEAIYISHRFIALPSYFLKTNNTTAELLLRYLFV